MTLASQALRGYGSIVFVMSCVRPFWVHRSVWRNGARFHEIADRPMPREPRGVGGLSEVGHGVRLDVFVVTYNHLLFPLAGRLHPISSSRILCVPRMCLTCWQGCAVIGPLSATRTPPVCIVRAAAAPGNTPPEKTRALRHTADSMSRVLERSSRFRGPD